MKPSPTAVESLKSVPVVRTAGDLRMVLANTLTALVRKEISATDAHAVASVSDALCRVLDSEIKAARLKLDNAKNAGKLVELTEIGQLVVTGEHPAPHRE